jgi:hypothetical protein
MIDIQPHIDKLKVLGEYMDYFIQCKVYKEEYENPKNIFRIFEETGYIISTSAKLRIKTFEQFYQSKTKHLPQ